MSTGASDDLDRLLGAARDELDELDEHNAAQCPGRADAFVEHGRWWSEQRRRARDARRVVTFGALLYFALFGWILNGFYDSLQRLGGLSEVSDTALLMAFVEVLFGLAVPIALASLAVFLAHRPSFGAQLFSRALLWAMTLTVGLAQVLMLEVLEVVNQQPGTEDGTLVPQAHLVLVANLACVGALLILGDHGLRSPTRRGFRPVAFQGVLTLSLVMGVADALILLLAGTQFGIVPPALPLAAWLLVSAHGLYRLRTWALAAMAAANLAELVLALNSMLDGLGPYVNVLILTAVVQLLLPVPVYGAMLRGRAPKTNSIGFVRRIPAFVLIGFAVLGIVQWATTLAVL